MNKKKFDLWMTSIDDSYLEEASVVPEKSKRYRILLPVVAACLILAVTGLFIRHGRLQDQDSDQPSHLAENSIPSTVPAFAPTSASMVEPEDEVTRKYFSKNGTDYTMLSCEAAEATDISGLDNTAEPLVWYAGGLEIKLCSTKDMAWASWYDTNTGTQWCLMSETSSLSLLTTASEIVAELGYNVAVAPEGATDITYDAFRINDLTVAETTFLFGDIRYRYRMAATADISEDFADISGTGTNYDTHITTEIAWCPAKAYYTETGYGKIIWFDIVPGLLYSLSMETNSSEEALLQMARTLFAPAQDTAAY